MAGKLPFPASSRKRDRVHFNFSRRGLKKRKLMERIPTHEIPLACHSERSEVQPAGWFDIQLFAHASELVALFRSAQGDKLGLKTIPAQRLGVRSK